MILIIPGIHQIFFPLRLRIIAVRLHQVPVHCLADRIPGHIECILALSNILYNLRLCSRLFMHLTECRLWKCLSSFNRSLRENPPFITVPVALIQHKNLASEDYDSAAACCLSHCNSFLPVRSLFRLSQLLFLSAEHSVLKVYRILKQLSTVVGIKYLFGNRNSDR